MRFILFFIFFGLWSGLWWWHYTCHIKLSCCPEDLVSVVVEKPDLEGTTVVFRWSEAEPYRGSEFPRLVDSLYSELDHEDTLQIVGYYFRDESDPEAGVNLGLARADKIAAFFPILNEHGRVQTSGKAVPLRGDFRDQMFEAVAFHIASPVVVVPEIEERATLRFPYNSTRRIGEHEHSEYLDRLAEYLKSTGHKVVITGHTDDMGTNESNYYLGLWRAAGVRDYLVSKGVPDGLIDVRSKGEIDPVASNATYAGKRENRRVEIEILKEN